MLSAALSQGLWTLSVCLLVSASEVPERNILRAEPGHNVTLTCHVPNNMSIIVVEWSRPDQEPEYVFLYRSGRPDITKQHRSFKNRVELNRQVEDGDVSVVLKNVTTDDSGTYECRVAQRGRNNRKKRANLDSGPISVINLRVQPGHTEEGGNSRSHVGLRVGLFVAVVAVVAVVGLIIRDRRRLRSDNLGDPGVA